MATIKALLAREILDSRGNPTLEVTVELRDGSSGTAAVPSGASTGSHEARELRDGDLKRFHGLGVRRAARRVNVDLAKLLRGFRANDQRAVDEAMIRFDGTALKSRLGANAILSVSLAVAHAAAASEERPLYVSLRQSYVRVTRDPLLLKRPFRLPRPMMNVVNGGVHAPGGPDAQEFMLLPDRGSFHENLRLGAEVFGSLRKILQRRGFATTVGDEGGFAPPLKDIGEVLRLLKAAVLEAGYRPGRDVRFGLDVAASELFNRKKQRYEFERERKRYSATELVTRYRRLAAAYPLESIEDGMAEDDWSGWQQLTRALGTTVTLVGDDLFVTNARRLQLGVSHGVANAILIKPNQVGTLTETFACVALARRAGYRVAVSHRSGETTDATIVDLSVAVNAEYLKAGSLSRGERLAKYNRLLEIEAEL